VLSDLDGKINFVLDGGPTPIGLESTIVDCIGDQPRLLRAGGVPRGDIEKALGVKLLDAPKSDTQAPSAPGQLASHYATRASLRLDAEEVMPGEALLAFGTKMPQSAAHAKMILNLSPGGDLTEAAANLFAHLRALDTSGASSIAVVAIPAQGLGEAIQDRLRRAAAPKV
jgi:L-threonylcarbamoyladenylate synthase